MREKPSAFARFVGAALIAIGGLITLLSGACTGFYLYVSSQAINRAEAIGPLIGALNGLPLIAIGIAFIVAGYRLTR